MSDWYTKYANFMLGFFFCAMITRGQEGDYRAVLFCLTVIAIIWSPLLVEQIKIWRSEEDEV